MYTSNRQNYNFFWRIDKAEVSIEAEQFNQLGIWKDREGKTEREKASDKKIEK